MLSYINFQFATLRKKVGPYIIAAVGILLIGLLAILSAKSANDRGVSSLGSIATFTKFFPFLFAVLFSALVITHIFKEGEIDGSELIVVAKPLTRMQIVFGKFILSLAYILAFQLFMFVGYVVITQFDKVATFSEKFKWAASLLVGGIIVQIIASSIIIMLASALGKVGTIVISILFGAALPILSFILVPLGKGWRTGAIKDSVYQKEVMVDIDSTNNQYVSSDASSVYEKVTDIAGFNSQYGDGGWYKGAAYFDVWYHWGRFFSALMPTDTADVAIVKWETKTSAHPTTATLETTQGNWNLVATQAGLNNGLVTDKNRIINQDLAIDKSSVKTFIQQNLQKFNDAPQLNRMAYIASEDPKMLEKTYVVNEGDLSWKHSTTSGDSSVVSKDENASVIASSIIINDMSKNIAITMADKMAETTNASYFERLGISSASNNTYIILQPKDFIPTGIVVAAWSIIGLAMCGASLLIYSRRDFK